MEKWGKEPGLPRSANLAPSKLSVGLSLPSTAILYSCGQSLVTQYVRYIFGIKCRVRRREDA